MEPIPLGQDFSECTRLGIVHSPSGNFLTAEVFNSEINVSGLALRRKQLWTLVTEKGRPNTVYLQSHLGRFLSADRDGKVSGFARTPGTEERFLLEYSPEATGEWTFRSEAHGFYLSGSDAGVTCQSKVPVWWAIRLADHPQIHIRHHVRSRYLRLLPNETELRADLAHPWGPESLFWTEQLPFSARGPGPANPIGRSSVARLGRVMLRTQSGLYLKPDGSFTDRLDDSVLFSVELRPGHPRTFAFRDSTGAYLTAMGPGTVKVKPKVYTPGKEELFLFERAAQQIAVLASNGKFVSVKQGMEISANQQEVDDTAIFQLEYEGGVGFNCANAIASGANQMPQSPAGDFVSEPVLTTNGKISEIYTVSTGYWCLRARSGALWHMPASSPVKITASDKDKDRQFEILALANDGSGSTQYGQVVLRTNSQVGGQSLSARKLGAVWSSGRAVNETEAPPETDIFRLILVNRPSIVFRSMFTGGFVSRGKQSQLDCLSLAYERVELKLTRNYTYQLFMCDQNSSYSLWSVGTNGYLQLRSTKASPSDDSQAHVIEPGTEFVFYYLDTHRVIVHSVGPHVKRSELYLLRAEVKGEVKFGLTNEILSSYIWEI